VPAVGSKPLRRVVREPADHLAVDGDAVVVVEDDELAQAQGARQRAYLVGDSLHQAAIAAERIGVVVDDGEAGAVEFIGKELLRERHADRIRHSLAERAGRGLNTQREVVLGVTRGLAAQLPERLQVLDLEGVAGQIKQGIQQHRAVPVGQHEAVAIDPARVARVVPEEAPPQDLGDVRHAHGHARVARIRPLHGVHGQCADGVGKFARRAHAGSFERPRRPR
jgi:hypothetical protein